MQGEMIVESGSGSEYVCTYIYICIFYVFNSAYPSLDFGETSLH